MLITRQSKCWNAKWRPCEWFAPADFRLETVQKKASRVVEVGGHFMEFFKKWDFVALKKQCAKLGLSARGPKADLVERVAQKHAETAADGLLKGAVVVGTRGWLEFVIIAW